MLTITGHKVDPEVIVRAQLDAKRERAAAFLAAIARKPALVRADIIFRVGGRID